MVSHHTDVPEQDTGSGHVLDAEFALLLRGIWTSIVRATRAMEHLPTLPGQHVEVLQRLMEVGSMTPAQLAVDLRLARPTVSELISKMVASGLIVRVPSSTDGRSVLLAPTEEALEVSQAFRRGVAEAVGAGLRRLSDDHRRQLLGQVPMLRELQVHLVDISNQVAEEGAPGGT